MYKQTKIDITQLNIWFGKRFAKSVGKNIGIKNWTNVETEYGYIDDSFEESEGANFIISPKTFTVYDLDDEDSVIAVRKYLQVNEIDYIEQKTSKGYHVYFKYNPKIINGNHKKMLCNLYTDVKNHKAINNNLAIKTNHKWREWSMWSHNEEVKDDLNKLLSEVPPILYISKKDHLGLTPNEEIGPGNRSTPLYKYSKWVAEPISKMFQHNYGEAVHKVIQDYNTYFIDGLSRRDLTNSILSQIKAVGDSPIGIRANALANQILFDNYLSIGALEEDLLDEAEKIESYVNKLQTYMLANRRQSIYESARTFNVYNEVMNDITQQNGTYKAFVKICNHFDLDIDELEVDDIYEHPNKLEIIKLYEIVKKVNGKSYKLQKFLQQMDESYKMVRVPKWKLRELRGISMNSRIIRELKTSPYRDTYIKMILGEKLTQEESDEIHERI